MGIVAKLRRAYNLSLNAINRFFAKKCTASVADLMLIRHDVDCNQILSITRYLDVINYIENKDKSFVNQNTISRATYGVHHKEERGNNEFSQLIASFQKNGYNENSYFCVDRDCRLLDGNHRMGLCLYMGITDINLSYWRTKTKIKFGMGRYYSLGIDPETVVTWKKTLEKVNEKFINDGRCFVAVFRDASLIEELSSYTSLQKNYVLMDDGQQTYVSVFALKEPKYICRKSELVSRTAQTLQRKLSKIAPIVISKNCTQGKQMYDALNFESVTTL